MIEITGEIINVEMVDGTAIVVFAFKNDFGDEGIRVTMLPDYTKAAWNLNIFKPVTIKGLCTGYNGQDIIFENGSIVGKCVKYFTGKPITMKTLSKIFTLIFDSLHPSSYPLKDLMDMLGAVDSVCSRLFNLSNA
ncbi:MAG: hypothetical protein MZV63_27120 [Marinilabiliales bacterium]|nr:hypothetical protein [Marinilabiliales bacterium]